MNHTSTQLHTRTNAGFTLIETLIAIFILALTIGALLTLTAGGFFSIRYAKNDIVATNLLQESLEYVHNTRDTAAQAGMSWDGWIEPYVTNKCFEDTGCTINPYSSEPTKIINACDSDCPNIDYFPDNGFYAYNLYAGNVFDTSASTANAYKTSFVRTIRMKEINTDPSNPQIIVTARMDWLNGTNVKHAEQSIILTKWNLQ